MKLGYACLNVTLGTKMRSCRIKTVESLGMEKIKELTIINLMEVKNIIQWNIDNEIDFFRVSSDIVPFGSHPILTWAWWLDEEVLAITAQINVLKQKNKTRLTVHPGQYTILNSQSQNVVDNAVRDLEYHNKLLNLIGGTDMVIHVGGVYGDKEAAKKRWIANYQRLSDDIKSKLILENDDKSFNLQDVLEIHSETGVPVCFDIHHHICNKAKGLNLEEGLDLVFQSWQGQRKPKMHISSGKNSKLDQAHHDYILEEDFRAFLNILKDKDVDIMFEAKKKELAVLKIKKQLNEFDNYSLNV